MNLKNNTSEISVVVQGSISDLTKSCIASVRKFLPEATIIVSTNSESNLNDLDCDKVVVVDDVGANYTTIIGGDKPNNINRQIASTIAGIKEVTTKYTFKIRSDFVLTGNNFLDYFDQYNLFHTDNKFFEKRILICTFVTRRAHAFSKIKYQGYPYHFSDFAQFGLTQDLYKLWNIDLVSDEDLNWFKKPLKDEAPFRHRYTVEQQLFVQFMKKNNISYHADFFCDRNRQNAKQTDLIVANNFVLLNFKQYCLKPSKQLFKPKYEFHYIFCYTHDDWLRLYKNYCDSSLKIPAIDKDFFRFLTFHWGILFNLEKERRKTSYHLTRILSPFKIIAESLISLVILPFYLLRLLFKLPTRIIKIGHSLYLYKHQINK